MHRADAQLRHRELTQEVYNIGDEVAAYIENLAEAVADWDVHLVRDCLIEFDEIITDARNDSRVVSAELYGVRQALSSGIRGGTVGVSRERREPTVQRPNPLGADTLCEWFPLEGPVGVEQHFTALDARTRAVVKHCERVVEWVLDQTAVAAADLSAISLPMLYGRTKALVEDCAHAWIDCVVLLDPSYAQAMRGSNPPTFLGERARIDAVVARVQRALQQAGGA